MSIRFSNTGIEIYGWYDKCYIAIKSNYEKDNR